MPIGPLPLPPPAVVKPLPQSAISKPSLLVNESSIVTKTSIGIKRKAQDESPISGPRKVLKNGTSTTVTASSRSTSATGSPMSTPSRAGTASVAASVKGAGATTTATNGAVNGSASAAASGPKPPLRKGTFAETIARAQAAQAAATRIGAIKHKPIEQVGQKGLRQHQGKARRTKSTPGTPNGRNGATTPTGNGNGTQNTSTTLNKTTTATGPTGKPAMSHLDYKGTARPRTSVSPSKTAAARPRPELEYKGTARPTKKMDLGYKGTARSADKPALRAVAARPSTPQKRRVSVTSGSSPRKRLVRGRRPQSEERDDDESSSGYGKDEDRYYSDGSSDMEAAAFEVEHEEYLSLKEAKKEDDEAERLEAELRRKKELKKRALAKKH
jgi:hypothetical protein